MTDYSKITALYSRLSVGDEDRDGGESNSIQNQKIFLENYARGQHLTNIRHYIDDDESGRFFDRSAYSRMMDDVENGKIGVCIMKDLTRWGRDYLQVGNAMEIFRRNNVRFIAVNNGIDSEKPDTLEFAPFINIMSEWYAKDISKKVKTGIKTKGMSGKPIVTEAPYGYVKDPDNKDFWIIDEEAAEVVRLIFRLFIGGKNRNQIAVYLTQEQIPTPTFYMKDRGRGTCKNKTLNEDNRCKWNKATLTNNKSFSDTDHAINVDKANRYASYRFGTPHTVEVVNGTLTGPGVLNAKSSGKFLENDTVSITPYERKGKSGEDIPFKGWTSSDVTLSSPTTAANSFTVPNKDVTVTAKHDPFDGAPTFTPTGTTNTEGTLTFKTVVRLGDGTECFYLAKDGEQNDESKYKSFRTDTSTSISPYEHSYETRSLPGGNQVDEGDYYVVEYLNSKYYLSEKFTVSYTAAVTTYTVSFDANGGTGTMADVTGVTGSYTLPACTFTAPSDKQFKGWATSADGTAIPGTTIDVTADTTLYAIWENIPVTEHAITVTNGKATVGAGTEISKAAEGTTVTLTANAASDSEMFDKWVVEDGSASITLADANSATTTFTMPAGEVSVKATYRFYITINLAAGEGSGTMEPLILKNNDYGNYDLIAPDCTFTPPANKVFDKWQFSEDNSYLKPGDTKNIWHSDNGATLTAIWEDAPNANPAKPTISVNGTYTYTGSEQTATVSGYDSTTMNITGNVGTNAGGYTVSVTSKTGKWADGTTDAVTADWSIQKANPIYVVPTGLEGTKGNALSTVTLPDGFTWADGTTEMNTTGNQTFPATFTPSDTDNYNVVNNISVTVNVKEAAPTTYKVTVTNGAGSGDYAEGETVTITANAAPADKVFDKWEVVSGSIILADANSATTTFTMPASAVSVKATYKDAPHTHTFDQEIIKDAALKTAADCTHDAVYYKSCSCGAISTDDADTFTDTDSALGHDWPEEGSWSKDADKHWYECSRCHLKKDEAAHDYGDDDICDICTYDNSVPHTHNLTLVDENPATCTTPGNKAYYTCDGCDKWFEDASGSVEITDKTSVILTANGHTPSDWKFDADNHWKECTVVGCGVIIEDSKAAHTASEWITDTPATATTDGTKHKECTVCHRKLETGTIPATGSGEHTHSYSSDWKSDSINHWHECSCGVKDDVAAHSFKWVIDKEATATKKGSKHEECKFCGYQRPAVEIPATGSTTKPTDPTESNPNTGALDDVPQTGDNSNMILWIVLLLASGLGVTGTVVYSKRKKYAK